MCVSPIEVKRKLGNSYRYVLVPCGKCSECLCKRQSGYTVRCIEEARKRGSIWFFTLTYSNDNLPYIEGFPSLRRSDVKKWKREVRRNYFRKTGVPFPDFSYMICGEYGTRTHRPHYHGYVCGLDNYHAHYLAKYWQDNYGFVLVKSIPFSSKDISCVSRYVAKYCVKPEGLKVPNSKVEKPRVQTSVGFGLPSDFDDRKSYYLDGVNPRTLQGFTRGSLDTIKNRLKYSFGGVSYSLPLYLKKKLLYEKGLSGNYKASALSHLLTSSLQFSLIEDVDSVLQSVEACEDSREAREKVARYFMGKESDIESRDYLSEKNLRSFLQRQKL